MDYEKKYREAQKWMESIYSELSHEQQMEAEAFFPELQESKDERIRKEIIETFKILGDGKIPVDINYADIFTWLEKQGEQKSIDKEYTFKSIPRLLDMIEPTDRAKSYCKKLIDSLQTEGYSIDAKIVGECLKQMNGEKVAMAVMDIEKQGEQKPSDEDMKEALRTEYEKDRADAFAEMQKEWSEDDEKRLQSCINILKAKSLMGKVDTANTMWLKSLKQRIGGKL